MGNYLITGAASGIGQATADLFSGRGHLIYALDIHAVSPKEHLISITADITDASALQAVFQKLSEQNIQLDGIIHCAGVHRMASLVEGDFQPMQQLMAVNLLGAMQVVHTFYPLLREKGRILIVTSEVAGFDPMPFNGLYNVSKTALDTYAQALRQELNLRGQRVITIRPGATETPLAAGSVTDTAKLAASTSLYAKEARNFSGLAARFMGKPIPPHRVAALIDKAMAAKHPRLTYRIHRNPGLVCLNLLPKRLQCGIIKLLLTYGKS